MLSVWGPSSIFSIGLWHEPVLKVLVHKPFVHQLTLFFPFPLSSLFFPSSSQPHHTFCPNFFKI